MSQKQIFLSFLLLVVGVFIGFSLARIGQPAGVSPSELEKLKFQIEQAKKIFPVLPADVRFFSGTVKNISGHVITLEVNIVNPLEDLPNPREVIVSDKTRIVRLQPKNPAAYQKELDAYNALFKKPTKPGSPLPVPPKPNGEIPISLNDIKVGMNIAVTADENIRDKASFEATNIGIDSIQFSSNPVAQ